MIPSGERITLRAGSSAWLTQSLGTGFTVMTDRGYMVRIDGRDADAIGLEPPAQSWREGDEERRDAATVEKRVWEQLRSCFDPEIPVNIVDLGLIYRCSVAPGPEGCRVEVRFTLTARGCGMGQFLKQDIESKLSRIPGVAEVDVELVWDPPWNQSMISPSARQQLGIV